MEIFSPNLDFNVRNVGVTEVRERWRPEKSLWFFLCVLPALSMGQASKHGGFKLRLLL